MTVEMREMIAECLHIGGLGYFNWVIIQDKDSQDRKDTAKALHEEGMLVFGKYPVWVEQGNGSCSWFGRLTEKGLKKAAEFGFIYRDEIKKRLT